DVMLSNGKGLAQVLQAMEISEATYPPLAKPVRWHEERRSQTAQGTGEREVAAETPAGRGRTGQGTAQGGAPGKRMSPTQQRHAVQRVRRKFLVSERRP